jgi:hypothetical protein
MELIRGRWIGREEKRRLTVYKDTIYSHPPGSIDTHLGNQSIQGELHSFAQRNAISLVLRPARLGRGSYDLHKQKLFPVRAPDCNHAADTIGLLANALTRPYLIVLRVDIRHISVDCRSYKSLLPPSYVVAEEKRKEN